MPSISAQNIGTSVFEMLWDLRARRVPNIDSASSIKTNASLPSSFFLTGDLKNLSDLPFGFTEPHVEDLGSLDV